MTVFKFVIILSSLLIYSTASFAQTSTPLFDLLKARDFEQLESATKEVQSKFENGSLSEIELRNTFRQFYNLDRDALNKVREWNSKFPTSYAAHLIRGTYFKRLGNDTRGTKYISEVSQERLEKMRQYHENAKLDLMNSLMLTQKPYLSVFHLLDICQSDGDKTTALALLKSAIKMLPDNTLVRNRYISSLEPRWGGSYEQMKAFIERSKTEGVSNIGIMQLEAIMYDDMGYTLFEMGDKSSAIEYYLKALKLGHLVGGEFRKDYLSHSKNICCSEPALKQYCQ